MFGEIGLTPDPVHDLEVPRARLAARAQCLDQEGEVLERLPLEAEVVQRPEHERGVADPGVAVVPVALAARRLRERGRPGGHDRPGRRVAQRLQRERAPLDVGAPGVVGDGGQCEPVAPVLLGGGELLQGLGLGGRAVALPREREPGRLALLERGATVGARPEDPESEAPREVEGEVARANGDPLVPAVVVGPLAGSGAVVELGDAVRLHLDPSAATRGDAQQRALAHRVAGNPPIALTALVGRRGPHDEQVVHDQPPGRRVPGGLEHVRAGHVPALVGDVDAGGPEPEQAGRAIEQRPEEARRVGAGQAEPLHRPVGGDERAHLAVGQERVVGDVRERAHGRRVWHDAPGSSCRSHRHCPAERRTGRDPGRSTSSTGADR